MQDFIKQNKAKQEVFKELTFKDEKTSELCAKRMRELLTLHEKTSCMVKAMQIKGKEWDDTNKHLVDEYRTLHEHIRKINRHLSKIAQTEHDDLKRTSLFVNEATQALNKVLAFGRGLQTLARLNRKLETEHEQIFPFNPLYETPLPLAPLESFDEELVYVADEKTPIEEPSPPTLPTFHWSTHAVDDTGNEVEELDCLKKFQKRYNKAMLDKLALQLERRKLVSENQRLHLLVCKRLGTHSH